jgi:hypothetical protein
MANLNIRDVDEAVLWEFRSAASDAKKKLRDWVLDTLSEAVKRGGKVETVVGTPKVVIKKSPPMVLELEEVEFPDEKSAQAKTRPVSVVDRPYLGPAHAASCSCKSCRLKRGEKV